MTTKHTIRTLFTACTSMCLAVLPLAAAISGSDEFNDNSKDISKWGADNNFGTAGQLTEVG